VKNFKDVVFKPKKNVFFLLVFLCSMCGFYFFQEIYPRINYGNFRTLYSLQVPFKDFRIIPYKDSLFIYGTFISKPDNESSSNFVQIYNTIDNKINSYDQELVKYLELTNLDVVRVWNDYLVILRKGIHNNSLKDTLCYYNLETRRYDRIIKLEEEYNRYFVLDNGDSVLYTNDKAVKYSFKDNFFKNIFQGNSKTNSVILGEIPLENNTYLIVTRLYNYVFKNDTFVELPPIDFSVEDFNNSLSIDSQYPRFLSVSDNRFIMISYYSKENLNKISLYEFSDNEIRLLSEFKTNKMLYPFTSSQVLLLNDNNVIFLSGRYGIYPLLTFRAKQNFLYDIKRNKLTKITSFSCPKRGFVSTVLNNKVYVVGGFCNGHWIKNIEVLDNTKWRF